MYSEEEMILQMLGVSDAGRGEKLMQDPSRHQWGLEGYPLASVYAPLQKWQNLYDNETGLSRGTIFKELEKPFLGAGGARNGML